VVQLACWREAGHPEGPWQARKLGQSETHEVQKGQVQDPVPGLGQSVVSIQTA